MELERCLTAVLGEVELESVLVRVFNAVERHHDQSNSYKGKHLIGAGLRFQRFSPLSSWWEAWWHAGRHGAGEGAKNSMYRSKGNRKRLRHTSSNKVTPTSARLHLLIVPLPVRLAIAPQGYTHL